MMLVEMLKYKRPSDSWSEEEFCRKYIEPVFGEADEFGNYIHTVYNKIPRGLVQPNVCFTAHYDTVHRLPGMQNVVVTGDIVSVVGSDCLGADCTTGVWLILGMIEAKVPGVYVIHYGEESGCIGSGNLVASKPHWLEHIEAVISFDRKGEESIITHQMGVRTASDAFALSLADALDMPNLRPDPTGSYTDSNEYIDLVSECTNLSVGYLNQHTSKETQNLYFAEQLLDSLINADWSKLVFERDPTSYSNYYDDDYGQVRTRPRGQGKRGNVEDLGDLIWDFPDELAEVLDDWGVDAEYLYSQIRQFKEAV
jgi:hypothetical protein